MKIAHARSNEMGQTTGGRPGDQTGNEVVINEYFEYEWTDVFRPLVNPDAYAAAAQVICKNDSVGYDHNDRYSLTLLARQMGWDFAKVTTPCNTDCSAMVAAVCNACGVPVNIYMWTGIQIGEMEKTGAYRHFAYTDKSQLRNGDIILTTRKGHTGIVIGNPAPAPVFETFVGEAYGAKTVPVYKAASIGSGLLPQWSALATGNLFDVVGESGNFWKIRIAAKHIGYIEKRFCLRKTPIRTGTVTTALHLRTGAGTGNKSIMIMPKNKQVQICDEKLASTGKPWYYVFVDGFYGFASSTYIK